MTHDDRTPNRLIHEPSPYLQQHAYNPVDWYPWGDEALHRAKAEDKPIFLSVGYSACHWCHVMERESFANPAIAEIMNRHFINIKVDREERPDLDHIYQSVCQLVTRQGGWPLTVFLTPDRQPFYVGTYFPPEDRFGRPGFPRLLMAVASAYRERREEVLRVAANWTENLRQAEQVPPPAGAVPGADAILAAARELAGQVDRQHGGLGGAPKFPNPAPLDLLLRAYRRGGGSELLALVELTLQRMAAGGLYDQLGGGFHRYSVDARWAVPHFEKMLYDNALLPPVYLAAWQITGNPLYARIVRETLAYVEREMQHPAGGFYSTQDADSEGHEGRFFVWTPAQVAAVLGAEDGELACRHLGVTPAGNFEGGATVLHWAAEPEALGVPAEKLAALRQRLWAAREQRPRPARDEKVLTGWNGLMITAFARAALALGDAHYAGVARRAADFVLTHLRAPGGGLLRRWKDGQAAIPGFLEDYAYLTQGLLDLHLATLEEGYLQAAAELARTTVQRFWDGEAGGFYSTAAGAPELIHRPREVVDSATPAGNSIATLNLLRLYPHTGDESYRTLPEQVWRGYRLHMERMPWGMASLLGALDFYLAGGTEVTLVAAAGDPAAAAWIRELGRRYLPNLVLARVDPPGDAGGPPIRAGKTPQDGKATLYVCQNFACSPPATTWAEAAAWLDQGDVGNG